MTLFNLITSGEALNEIGKQLCRIADTLDRAIPPAPRPVTDEPDTSTAVGRGDVFDSQPQSLSAPSFAESGEEYDARIQHEHDLADSLGVASFNPEFRAAIDQMRRDLMSQRRVINEAGETVEAEGYTEEEADQIVRQAFQQAKAQGNERRTPTPTFA